MNLEEMLALATAELEAAEADYLAARQRVEELRTMQDGMRLAMERYGSAEPPTPKANDDALATDSGAGETKAEQSGLGTQDGVAPSRITPAARRPKRRPAKRTKPVENQTDLCFAALTQIGRRATTAEVRDILEQKGHRYDSEQIRSAFAYLMRKDRVVRVEPGVWELAPDRPVTIGSGASTLNGASAGH